MQTMYDRIKKLRTDKMISQQKLAEMVGYKDKTAIAHIEAGRIDLPQSKIVAFAEALQTSVSYLLDGYEEANDIDQIINKIKDFYNSKEFNFNGINYDVFIQDVIMEINHIYDIKNTPVPDQEIRRICNMTFTKLNRELNQASDVVANNLLVENITDENHKKAMDLYNKYLNADAKTKKMIDILLEEGE